MTSSRGYRGFFEAEESSYIVPENARANPCGATRVRQFSTKSASGLDAQFLLRWRYWSTVPEYHTESPYRPTPANP